MAFISLFPFSRHSHHCQQFPNPSLLSSPFGQSVISFQLYSFPIIFDLHMVRRRRSPSPDLSSGAELDSETEQPPRHRRRLVDVAAELKKDGKNAKR